MKKRLKAWLRWPERGSHYWECKCEFPDCLCLSCRRDGHGFCCNKVSNCCPVSHCPDYLPDKPLAKEPEK